MVDMKNEWNFQASPEGSALVLGPMFDFDGMILLEDNDTVTFRITVRKDNHYDELVEMSVPKLELQRLLEQ